jgi:hypothetical protein
VLKRYIVAQSCFSVTLFLWRKEISKTINFILDRIRSLVSPVDKDREGYYDKGCPTLMCRISNAGNKSFVVLKKTTDGKTRRITLGRFPDLYLFWYGRS